EAVAADSVILDSAFKRPAQVSGRTVEPGVTVFVGQPEQAARSRLRLVEGCGFHFPARSAGQSDATGEMIVAPVRESVPVLRKLDLGVWFSATRFELSQQLLVAELRTAKLLLEDFCLLVGILVLRQPLF